MARGRRPFEESLLAFDSPAHVVIEYEVPRLLADAVLMVRLSNAEGDVLLTSWEVDGQPEQPRPRVAGTHRARCRLPSKLFVPGLYRVGVGVRIPRNRIVEDLDRLVTFEVTGESYPLNAGRTGRVTALLEWNTQLLEEDVNA